MNIVLVSLGVLWLHCVIRHGQFLLWCFVTKLKAEARLALALKHFLKGTLEMLTKANSSALQVDVLKSFCKKRSCFRIYLILYAKTYFSELGYHFCLIFYLRINYCFQLSLNDKYIYATYDPVAPWALCVDSLPQVEYKLFLAKYLLFPEYPKTMASCEWAFYFRSTVRRRNGFLLVLCYIVIALPFLSFPLAWGNSFLLFAEVLISGLH